MPFRKRKTSSSHTEIDGLTHQNIPSRNSNIKCITNHQNVKKRWKANQPTNQSNTIEILIWLTCKIKLQKKREKQTIKTRYLDKYICCSTFPNTRVPVRIHDPDGPVIQGGKVQHVQCPRGCIPKIQEYQTKQYKGSLGYASTHFATHN